MCNNTNSTALTTASTSLVLELEIPHTLPSASNAAIERYQESLLSDIATLLSEVDRDHSMLVSDICTEIISQPPTYTPMVSNTSSSTSSYTSMASLLTPSPREQSASYQPAYTRTSGYTPLRS